MSGYRINPRSGRGHLFPKCHFQNLYFCNIHAGDIFYNGGSSLTIGRRQSIICNRLLKLSDENGEEVTLTGMSFRGNLYISLIRARSLLIKSEFRELIT